MLCSVLILTLYYMAQYVLLCSDLNTYRVVQFALLSQYIVPVPAKSRKPERKRKPPRESAGGHHMVEQ